MIDISIVIPAKNEQENIKPLINEITSAMVDYPSWQLIYVDDGSQDNTFAELMAMRAQLPKLTIIRHQDSMGQSCSVYTGIQHAKGELIVTLDADGQNNPADIPNLLEKAKQLEKGSHFCIAGYRKNRSGDTPWKRWQSKIANSVRSKILKDNTPDTGCGLKVFPKHTFLLLPFFDHMHRFLPALIRRINGEVVICEVSHRERFAGNSNYTMMNRLWVGIIDMMGVAWLQRRGKTPQIVNVEE